MLLVVFAVIKGLPKAERKKNGAKSFFAGGAQKNFVGIFGDGKRKIRSTGKEPEEAALGKSLRYQEEGSHTGSGGAGYKERKRQVRLLCRRRIEREGLQA